MTILVTGSAGHLGEALVRVLREEFGEGVRGLDIQASAFTDIVGTIVDPDICNQAMEGVTAVIHTASLHKPHVETHTRQDFVNVNITGTLNLLESAVRVGTVKAFIFTSTTSSFGDALKPEPGVECAVWIDESVRPRPKNIYGITKLAAEDLCHLYYRLYQLPSLVLKVSRFFPEDDDSKEARDFCSSDNLKANELLFRRADIYDMVTAHRIAIDKASEIGFDRFIISGTSPFRVEDLPRLYADAQTVVVSYFPSMERIYDKAKFKFFDSIDRVYSNEHARKKLGWEPVYSFQKALECIDRGESIGSPLGVEVGKKFYHGGKEFSTEETNGSPYPISAANSK